MDELIKVFGIVILVGVLIISCESEISSSQSNATDIPDRITGKQTIGSNAKSLGKVTVDTEVSSWDIGDGNPNGEFITAEVQGVVIGLRAMERFEGLLGVTSDKGKRIGVYEAETGFSPRSPGDNNGTWNYDFHVDLTEAVGVHKDKVLDDYRLTLEQNFTEESLFGILGNNPVELPLDAESNKGVCSADTFDPEGLCQQSWNPGFGNGDYNPNEERIYNLRLVLTPETFNANPLAVAIRVKVSD